MLTIALLTLVFVLLFVIYQQLTKHNDFFKKKGVPFIKPTLVFGNLSEFVFRKKPFSKIILETYRKFINERYYGFFQFMTPALVISDLELIKQITIKDFDSFTDHRKMAPDGVDPLWNSSLFATRGLKWRNLRIAMTPTFTSSKMKLIFHMMSNCAQKFVDHFLESDAKIVQVELKDIFRRFSTDVITSSILGIETSSLKEKDNIFYTMGRRITQIVDGSRGFILFLSTLSPKIMKIFDLPVIEKDIGRFFRELVDKLFADRRKSNVIRKDLLNILMQIQEGSLKEDQKQESDNSGFSASGEFYQEEDYKKVTITNDDIVAQVIIFYMGGIDTSSLLLSCMGYELVKNPDIQERLYREIKDKYDELNGQVQYDDVLSLKYLDMVISETLRKYPASPFLDRLVNKDYTIKAVRPTECDVTLNKGDLVMIPVYGLHFDPKNYPNPEKFDPERFSDENKHNIKPCTFLPFGNGPRNCIGSRFALLAAKVIYSRLLLNFRLVATEKTPKSFRVDPKSLNYSLIGGNWCGLERR